MDIPENYIEKCSQTKGYKFSAGSANGKFYGIWEGHTDEFDTEADLIAALNRHEKTLYEYGIKQ